MKRLLLLLLILPALACSSTITKPIAQMNDPLASETAIPSPTIAMTSTATASPDTCEVKSDALHLRDAPNIEGLVIAWLARGDQLTILPDPPVGDWVKVQTADDLTGWINSIYCERKTTS